MSLEQEVVADKDKTPDDKQDDAASQTKDEALEQQALDKAKCYVVGPPDLTEQPGCGLGVKVMASATGDAQKGSITLPIGARVVFADAPAEGMFDFSAKKRLEQNNMGQVLYPMSARDGFIRSSIARTLRPSGSVASMTSPSGSRRSRTS